MSRLALAWINEAGLLLIVLGGVIIFLWQPVFGRGPVHRLSSIGLGLIIAGFAAQVFAGWPR
jgi:hypothetical protein